MDIPLDFTYHYVVENIISIEIIIIIIVKLYFNRVTQLIQTNFLPSHPVLKDSSKTEDDMFEEIKRKEDESVSPLSNFYNGKYHKTKQDYFFFFTHI
jgi:hypothetical protein